MPPSYYLAIDIGASSGRHIIGWLEGDAIRVREIHRFANEAREINGVRQWDVDNLFAEIVAGLKKAGDMGTLPSSLGIDTWGVDFVLLDADGVRLGPAAAYRDRRTAGMDNKVYDIIGREELYARTGIQPLLINTIFQLFAVKKNAPNLLDRANALLMMPCYLNYLLTGKKANEYTDATTTQLVSAETGDWDWRIIETLGYPGRIFGPLAMPGHLVGTLAAEVRERVGYDLEVVLPPSHDTASAVLAMPEPEGNAIYLSSGTWSLMGIERDRPDCREICLRHGFTNEGGYGGSTRFLKNIMGLWILQSLHGELGSDLGFDDLIGMAEKGMNFGTFIDANHPSLLAPASMSRAIRDCCAERGGAVPANDHEILACAYKSLAKSYAETVDDIERLSGTTYDHICIMGGGSQDDFLNRLTAGFTGKGVQAGPVEATAIGNILSQMLRAGEFSSVSQARRAVGASFPIRKIDPYIQEKNHAAI